MKYKINLTKVLWAVAVMLALPLSALSQSWTASPVGNGTGYHKIAFISLRPSVFRYL